MASHKLTAVPSVQPRVRTRGSPSRVELHIEREADAVGAEAREPLRHFGRPFDRRTADDDAARRRCAAGRR